MATPSDFWTKGYDNNGDVVWIKNEGHYSNNAPGPLQVFPPRRFPGEAPYPSPSTGLPFKPRGQSPVLHPGALAGESFPYPPFIPPGQPPAFHPGAVAGVPQPSSPMDPPTHFPARPPTNMPMLPEYAPTHGRGWTAPGMYDNRPSRPRTPPTSLPLIMSKRAQEEDKWSQLRDSNGKTYYFNKVTGKSQTETPDCLKKYSTK